MSTATATAAAEAAAPAAFQQPTNLVFVPPHTETGWGRHHFLHYDKENFWTDYRGNLWSGDVVNQLGTKRVQTAVQHAFSLSHGALQFFFRPPRSGDYLITAEWRTLSVSRRGNGAAIATKIRFEAPGKNERRAAVPGSVERFGVRAYLRNDRTHRIRLGSEVSIYMRYLFGTFSGYGEVIGRLERLAIYEAAAVGGPEQEGSRGLVAELTDPIPEEIPEEILAQAQDDSEPLVDEQEVSWEELQEMRRQA